MHFLADHPLACIFLLREPLRWNKRSNTNTVHQSVASPRPPPLSPSRCVADAVVAAAVVVFASPLIPQHHHLLFSALWTGSYLIRRSIQRLTRACRVLLIVS